MTRPRRCTALAACALAFAAATSDADVAQTGQAGLIHMPDARVSDDGTWRFGAATMHPYGALWSSIALLPRLELSGRFTRIAGTQPFDDTGYGAHKDKAFDAKLSLIAERGRRPAIAVGVHDFVGDNQLFRAHYAVATRSFDVGAFGRFDASVGYGGGRIDGAFGGTRWHLPGVDGLRLVAEWDAFDYDGDFYDIQRRGGAGYALEYARGPVTAQFAYQDGHAGANVHVAMPLQARTYVPRIHEPEPVAIAARTVPADWVAPDSLAPLYVALAAEGFGDLHLMQDGDLVRVVATENRMSMVGRAVGRAARLVAAHAPPDAARLELTFTEFRQPLVTYRFDDLGAVRGYFDGSVDAPSLQRTVSVSYPDATRFAETLAGGHEWSDVFGPRESRFTATAGSPVFGLPVTIRTGGENGGVVRIRPVRASFTFNDPSGVLKHDVYSTASYTQWLSRHAYVNAGMRFTLHENVSDTVGSSNSLLPRVRSDVGRYRREGERLRLQTLHLGHLMNPADRVYTWLSAGIVEEMFAAVGGEVLYLPERGNWAIDFRAHYARQRDFRGWLGFLDHDVVTTLVSHHYRVPEHGLTFTTRVGRFLARDHGARFEMRRRFRSGFELGGWYSITDAKDITSPGSPENPYRDKGVFVRIALGPFLTRDNAAVVDLSLAPWARDPGQMLHAPGGLYEMFERRLLLNLQEFGPWSDFGY